MVRRERQEEKHKKRDNQEKRIELGRMFFEILPLRTLRVRFSLCAAIKQNQNSAVLQFGRWRICAKSYDWADWALEDEDDYYPLKIQTSPVGKSICVVENQLPIYECERMSDLIRHFSTHRSAEDVKDMCRSAQIVVLPLVLSSLRNGLLEITRLVDDIERLSLQHRASSEHEISRLMYKTANKLDRMSNHVGEFCLNSSW